jgi:hypothetical protein
MWLLSFLTVIGIVAASAQTTVGSYRTLLD